MFALHITDLLMLIEDTDSQRLSSYPAYAIR